MHKERKTAKETFVLIKTGFPFPEREFAVEKHFFKTGLTFLSVLTNISFLNIAFGTVQGVPSGIGTMLGYWGFLQVDTILGYRGSFQVRIHFRMQGKTPSEDTGGCGQTE